MYKFLFIFANIKRSFLPVFITNINFVTYLLILHND